MAVKASEKRVRAAIEKREVLQSSLETELEKLLTSDGWNAWLRAGAKFHKYSLSNQILIVSQLDSATQVAGYDAWLQLGRCVRKGEKSLKIFAPSLSKPSEEEQKAGVQSRLYFRTVSVFDISQTEIVDEEKAARFLTERPEPTTCLDGPDNQQLFERLSAVARSFGWTVEVKEVKDCDGYARYSTREIVVGEHLKPLKRCAVLAHEIGHTLMHDIKDYADHRPTFELEAESVAYMFMLSMGYDLGDVSAQYIAGWMQRQKERKPSLDSLLHPVEDDPIKALKASAASIHAAVAKIMEALDGDTKASLSNPVEIAA
jgi:hypothetical protein